MTGKQLSQKLRPKYTLIALGCEWILGHWDTIRNTGAINGWEGSSKQVFVSFSLVFFFLRVTKNVAEAEFKD